MANELTISAALSFTKGSVSGAGLSAGDTTFDVTGVDYVEGTMATATTPGGAIPIGDIASPGYMWAKNTDSTNSIYLIDSGGHGSPAVKLLPGEFVLFRWDSAAVPYAMASASTPILHYIIVEA